MGSHENSLILNDFTLIYEIIYENECDIAYDRKRKSMAFYIISPNFYFSFIKIKIKKILAEENVSS